MDISEVTPLKKLLVATDLSARSDNAVRRAALLAGELGAALEVLHVVDDTMPEKVVEAYENAARRSLSQLLGTLAAKLKSEPTVTFIRGHGYSAILQRAQKNDVDLIIIGITRHTLAALFTGTTAERIIRIGQVPVLMAKDEASGPYQRVLVATDNSPSAALALSCALAAAPKAKFCLVHVAHVPFQGLLGQESRDEIREERDRKFKDAISTQIAGAVEKLGIDPPETSVVIEEGDISHVVRDKIRAFDPDLLVLGTHGRAALRHALIGSLAQKILADPPADVLIAKA